MSLVNTVASRPSPPDLGNSDAKAGIEKYEPTEALEHLTLIFAQFGAIEATASETSGKLQSADLYIVELT
jgi:hypothetical protein